MARPENDVDIDDFDDGQSPPPATHPTLISGRTAVILVVLVGLLGAASGWVYIYDQKRLPQEFWGFESPRIFVNAERVTALLLKPESPGVAAETPYYDGLYMVDADRYVIVKKVDITKREDLSALTHALTDHRNFDANHKLWKDPLWRFGLIFEYPDKKSEVTFTASIVFDAEGRLGRPQSVNKTISTVPMSESLLNFFLQVFPEAKEMPTTAPIAGLQPQAEAPQAAAAGQGDGIVPQADREVITLRGGNSPLISPPAVPGLGPPAYPTLNQTIPLQGSTSPPPGSLQNEIQLPGQNAPRSGSPFPGGSGLDFSAPRGVTVPPLGGFKPGSSGS